MSARQFDSVMPEGLQICRWSVWMKSECLMDAIDENLDTGILDYICRVHQWLRHWRSRIGQPSDKVGIELCRYTVNTLLYEGTLIGLALGHPAPLDTQRFRKSGQTGRCSAYELFLSSETQIASHQYSSIDQCGYDNTSFQQQCLPRIETRLASCANNYHCGSYYMRVTSVSTCNHRSGFILLYY